MRTYETVVGKRSLSPATRTNGTANGTAIDLGPSGGDSALVVFITGTMTDGSHAASVEEADAVGGPYTAIPAARIHFGSLPTMTSTDSNKEFEVGVLPAKEFIRAVIVTSGATTGGITAAVVVIGETGLFPPVRT